MKKPKLKIYEKIQYTKIKNVYLFGLQSGNKLNFRCFVAPRYNPRSRRMFSYIFCIRVYH